MELREYLFKNRIKANDFARQLDVHTQTIRGVLGGGKPSIKLTKKIAMLTGWQVGFRDLLPDVYLSVIAEFHQMESQRIKNELQE